MTKGANALSHNNRTDHTFPKSARILKSRDYQAVYEDGKVQKGRYFRIHFCENRSELSRVGISINKRIGTAVRRNLLKRWIRETIRIHKNELPKGFDLVVHVRTFSMKLSFGLVHDELMTLFRPLRRNWNS